MNTRYLALSFFALASASFFGCGGSGTDLPPIMQYKVTEIQDPSGFFILTQDRTTFSGEVIRGNFFIVGNTITVGPAIPNSPLTTNSNIPDDATLVRPNAYGQRKNGDFIANQTASRGNGFDPFRRVYLGSPYLFPSLIAPGTALPGPTYRTEPDGLVPGTSDPFVVEGGRPVQITASDYLLVLTNNGFPAAGYRQNLVDGTFDLFGTGVYREAIIGESGQIAAVPDTGNTLYFADPSAPPVELVGDGNLHPRVILPNGTVVGEVGSLLLEGTQWWYYNPEEGETKTVTETGKKNITITGASAEGLMVGWYLDTVQNREVAFMSNELGVFIPLEDLTSDEDSLTRAYGINYDGRILVARLETGGTLKLCILDSVGR